MKKIIYIPYVFVLLIMNASCSDGNVDKILDSVENIIDSQPDSALILLNSIKYLYKPEIQQARHAIFTTYAKDLSGIDISKDTTIVHAINYLKTVNEPAYLAFAKYCMGRIYQEQGKNEKALELYLNAGNIAENSNGDNIKGLIASQTGQLYYNKREYGKAGNCFQSALKYFDKSQKNHKRKFALLNNMGNCLFLADKRDSAMIFYNEAFQLAANAQDSAYVMQNLGMIYLETNDLNRAKQQLFKALSLNSILQNRICLNLGKVYEKEKLQDSVAYFTGLSLKFAKNDDNILLNYYKMLSDMELEKGNYKKAFKYYKQYFNCFIQINKKTYQNDILVIERKHQIQTLSNKNDRLTKKNLWLESGILLLIAGMVVLAVILYRKNRQYKVIIRKKDADLENLIDRLDRQSAEIEETKASLNRKIDELQGKSSNIDTKEKMLSSIIHKSIRKIALFDYCIDFVNGKLNMKEFKSATKLLIPQNNEQLRFYDDLNVLYSNIFQQIKLKYPNLTEQELIIICLTFADFDNVDIAWSLSLNKHVVEQKKSDIRKKLNIKRRGDIKLFIVENMK